MGVMKSTAIAGMAVMLGISALPPVTLAQSTTGNPLVTGAIVRDYARITFYWPERIDMTATTNGKRLVVNFDRQVNPDFGTILRSLYPYVIKAELSANRRTIIFTMKAPYKIRSFITNSESGVDILDIHDSPSAPEQHVARSRPPAISQPEPETQPEPDAPRSPAVKPAVEAEPEKPAPTPKKPVIIEQPVTPKTEKAPPSTQQMPAPQKPAPQAPAVQKSIPAEETPKATPKIVQPAPEPAPAPKAAEKPVQAVPVVEVDETPLAPAPTAAVTAQAITPTAIAPSLQPEEPGAISGERVAVELTMVDKNPNLRFAFDDRIAAAAWQRDRTVMVLFDKPVTLTGLEAVKSGSNWLADIRQLGGERFTLLQMDLATDLVAKAFKDREGYGWQVQIFTHSMRPDISLEANILNVGGRNHVFIPITQAEEVITVKDPTLGGTLAVVPLYASGAGVFPPRGFAEFDLPATSQGIVVSSKSDELQVKRMDSGVHITTPNGLQVTESITAATVSGAKAADNREALFKPTLFPEREWKADDLPAFRERETYLLHVIASAADVATRNQNRLKLAQLYFAHEKYNETNALLSAIRRDDLDFFRHNKLAALEGASYLLNYRVQEAALALSSDTLDELEEGELLRKATSAQMGALEGPVPYLQYNDAYIRQYPSALRQRLALIAANNAILKEDYNNPARIFETLEEDKLSGEVAEYVNYLQAKLAAAAGRSAEAERIWGKQAANIMDRQFRARAEYSLVLLKLEQGSITPEEAIKRLDALRIVWRGDDLERSLLMVLGQLQVNQGNYWEGMKTWEELLQTYPNSPDAMNAYTRLAETFRSLFLDNGADSMEPVKMLALFSEFQELTPLGADGDKLAQKMVDRLVKMDLLDQAAARLDYQIQYRLKGEEKSRSGAQAAIIHLLNREPARALEALQKSREEDVPPALSLERNRIAAQALIDLNRIDQALTMVEGDYSADAENVRLEAYWTKEDWAYVIDIIELMLRKRQDLNAPFTEREGQRLLQLALAYIFVGEFDQLKYLRDAYAPLMDGNPYKEEFLFLTQDRIPTSSENFNKVIDGIGAIESFMDSYRERLEAGTISEAVGVVPAGEAAKAAPTEEAGNAPSNGEAVEATPAGDAQPPASPQTD